MTAPDVVVVGGGPAGSAAAAWLAEAGCSVVLIERTRGAHDKVCGEFLSGGARRLLADLGIATDASRRRVRLQCGARQVEAALPFDAAALPRRELDERLLAAAAARGAVIRRGIAVRRLEGAPPQVVLADGSTLAPRAVFLATGKHDLRGFRRTGGIQEGLLGLKMAFGTADGPPPREADDVIDLLLFEGGYAGWQSLGPASATLSLLVRPETYRRVGGSWPTLLAHVTADAAPWQARLDHYRAAWARPLAVHDQPYGYVAAPRQEAVYALGDQMAVVPSFTGEGIAIALASARLAVDHFLRHGGDAAPYHAEAALRFGRVRPIARAASLLERRAVQAAAVRAAGLAPGALGLIAGATRVSGR